jgi:hypothetical protein
MTIYLLRLDMYDNGDVITQVCPCATRKAAVQRLNAWVAAEQADMLHEDTDAALEDAARTPEQRIDDYFATSGEDTYTIQPVELVEEQPA